MPITHALLKVPEDAEARYEAILRTFRLLAQHEPTIEDKNATRQDLGLSLLTE